MNPINPILEDFGLTATSRIRLAEELAELHDGELDAILKSFGALNIPTHDSDRVNILTKRYAVVRAFENGSESVSDADMEWAQEKALVLVKKNGSGSGSTTGPIEDTPTSTKASDSPDSAPKRKRNPKLYPAIKRLVQASPDASKETIAEQVLEQYPGTVEGTIVMYYYKARKELGLKNNGKRGRKPSKVYPNVLAMVKANSDKERKELVAMAVESGVNESTANVYVGKALKELGH